MVVGVEMAGNSMLPPERQELSQLLFRRSMLLNAGVCCLTPEDGLVEL